MAVRKTYYWGLGRDEGSTLPMEYEECFARNEIFGIFRFDVEVRLESRFMHSRCLCPIGE